MNAITLKCQWLNGAASDTELPAVADPAQWSSQDARDAAWAIQRALRAVAVYAIRLQETSPTTWRVEIVANTGTATTVQPLPLSPAALDWFQEVAFELPERSVH